jgi:hypothetical protein
MNEWGGLGRAETRLMVSATYLLLDTRAKDAQLAGRIAKSGR